MSSATTSATSAATSAAADALVADALVADVQPVDVQYTMVDPTHALMTVTVIDERIDIDALQQDVNALIARITAMMADQLVDAPLEQFPLVPPRILIPSDCPTKPTEVGLCTTMAIDHRENRVPDYDDPERLWHLKWNYASRKCGICQRTGHDRRTCPSNKCKTCAQYDCICVLCPRCEENGYDVVCDFTDGHCPMCDPNPAELNKFEIEYKKAFPSNENRDAW